MFEYDVLTESEAMQERFQLLPEGEYEAVVSSSIDKQSQSGNPMMDIMLDVYDANGRPHSVRDFLVFTRGMMWKVVHCAESASIMKEYEARKFCSDTIRGCTVKVRITIEKGSEIPEDKLKGKAPGSRYPDKNKVEDYLANDGAAKKPVAEDFLDDTIPF